MQNPSDRAVRILSAAAAPAAIVVAAALIWNSSYAAFSGSTRNSGNSWATGAVAVTDDDAGSARFQVTNMLPGQSDTKCIAVTTNATVPGVVKGYAVNPVASGVGLENYIKVTVDEGTGGSFGSCSGFSASSTVIPTMTLGTLATFSNYANGAGGWTVQPGTSTRSYKITWTFDASSLSQSSLNALQGAQTGIDFQWELQNS
jgi:hypothetical protein